MTEDGEDVDVDKPAKIMMTRAILLIIGLAILLGLIWQVGITRFTQILLQTSPVLLVLSVAVYAASWILRTWRLERLVSCNGFHVPLSELFSIHISAFALNTFLPAKFGDAVMVCNLGAKGMGMGRAAAVVLHTRILDLSALCLLLAPSLCINADEVLPQWIHVGFVIALIVVITALVIGLTGRSQFVTETFHWLDGHIHWRLIRRVVNSLKQASASYHEMISNRPILLLCIFLSLAVWLIEVLTCLIIGHAVGSNISFSSIAIAVCVGNLCKGIPSTPGSVGVYEGALSMTLVLMGQPLEGALVIAILDHLIKKGFNVLVGMAFLADTRQASQWLAKVWSAE